MPVLRPKVRSDLSVVQMEGEAVIYDEQTGQIHYLNRTATIVFNLCDGSSTIQEFSGEIAEVFSLPRQEVERQVRSLIRSFREAGFFEQRGGTPPMASKNGAGSPDGKLKGKGTGGSGRRSKRS